MATEATTRRVLVLANEACGGEGLMRELRIRAEGDEVLIVAPALVSRLHYGCRTKMKGSLRPAVDSTSRSGAVRSQA